MKDETWKMENDNSTWPDLFVSEDFLEPLVCQRIMTELSAVAGRSSVVYGSSQSGVVDQSTRKSLRLTPSTETIELIVDRLLALKDKVERHFGVKLNQCEDPQFLRYEKGDFFVAHQDGNTGMLCLDTEDRLISTVIFLSRETESPENGAHVHCGGSLVFTNPRATPGRAKLRVRGEPGMLIAFRSETTHEVTPVTHGRRHSVVSWYR
jgi:SM-20-related protein